MRGWRSSGNRNSATVDAVNAGAVLDRYGFVVDEGTPPALAGEGTSAARRENVRAVKWQGMISEGDTFLNLKGDGYKKFKSRVRKGVPDGVRARVWQVASGSMALRAAQPGHYASLLRQKSPMDADIRKDLHRTMPRHVLFRGAPRNGDSSAGPPPDGQRQLYNVCHALSVHNPTVGYNQAEAYVAATLLTYMTEEEAFWLLAVIAGQRGYERMWTSTLEGWIEARERLDALTRAMLPRLHAHLEAQGVTPDIWALQWFLTLYSNGFPFESTLRVWDVFLCEPYPKGSKVLFRVALAVLKAGERELLRMTDIAQIVEHIKQLPATNPELQGDRLMANALKISLKSKQLGGLNGGAVAVRGGKQRS